MNVSTRATIEIAGSPEEVFDFVADPFLLARWLRELAPIPGVKAAEAIGERAQRVGSRRRIAMTDGAVLIEEVLVLDRPHRHAYRWEKPKLPFSLLVRSGRGDWTFAPSAAGTRVEWTYTFELTTPLVYLPGRLVVLAFNRWMRRNLARVEPELAAAGDAG